MSPVRILLADDHDVVRRGLRAILEEQPNWEICAEAVTGREAVEKTKKSKPDIVVLDFGMPELNGLEATRQILKVAPETEVVILTVHESETLIRELFAAGARGYVLKSDAGRDLVAAVESLSQHKLFFTSKVGEIVLEGLGKNGLLEQGVGRLRKHLSAREQEIVRLLAEGKSNKEIGAILNISVKTVETHRANIMRKLDIHSISDLVHYAIRNKLAEP